MAQSAKPQIVTTVAPLTSLAAAIGGDGVRIEGIVPEGTNSHTFEPEPRVAALLGQADLIFTNGLMLEEPTEKLAEQNKPKRTKIVELGTRVLPESQWIYDFSFPREQGKPNPHLWTDPTYAIKYAAVIRDELVQLDSPNADYYRRNYTAFEKAANALAAALRADQATIPNGRRELLTYHDAYAYFARTFGWKVIGAVQPRDFEDPAPAEVARLISQVKAARIPAIFGSEVFPSNVLKEIGDATGARYIDKLRDDDLPGKPGEAGHSWLGLMRFDYVTMVRGLGGTTANLDKVPLAQSGAPDRAVYPQ